MYINITIDLQRYNQEKFDLRLSNYHSIKKMIDIVWQTKQLGYLPREGCWVRVVNKQKIVSSTQRLIDVGITTGDRIEIL
ncbi:EsaB/YukD family protein [Aquibacillus rhizosphaerae]|uniref:EsaB/YukD family protein n=1 Tax=Aquibacillus rhizosphaerae TaxID=3051431 RepID=A0ABT7L3V6_9BACI|nr:EsaB/YukD family protein [Aquibacillus sp. LR5S19]MDL4840548.1 EsaB/YukD family protein [Aquibacillus sp. LR5S19]